MSVQLAPQFTQRAYSWTAWKALAATKNLLAQYDQDGGVYTIWGYDGPEVHICTIWQGDVPHGVVSGGYSQAQNDADKSDFETNTKPTANAPVELRTKDGRQIVRNSTANRTTNFKLRVVSFYSATLNALHNVNPVTDASYGDVTLKLYKANWDEITVEADEQYAVKTVIDFEPTYNYEIIGGMMDVPSSLKDGTTNEWFISAIGVPDYPPVYYGSIDFISEVNLEAVTTQKVNSDGRAVSYMPYNSGGYPHTNRLRFILKHPAGGKKRFQLYIEHFT